ncbi:MAG: hypothetical protein ACRECA_01595 [Pseudolabrys sp.]
MTSTSRLALLALTLIGAAWSAPSRANSATTDRIFADGFENCCRLGGTVAGLSGSGLVLHLAAGSIAEDKPIGGSGLYNFIHPVPPGVVYTLSIKTQPNGQTCSLQTTGGTMGTTPFDNADVSCGGNLIWDRGSWDSGNWN